MILLSIALAAPPVSVYVLRESASEKRERSCTAEGLKADALMGSLNESTSSAASKSNDTKPNSSGGSASRI